ncbi:hypothetical protein BCR44DRAFT_1001359 [Catenaria anguillulae PL171]|uniref:Uncharacterized protein n=1 Tax=Catenaria anguillulae PL171 TaxID=765915 RepID=A0A1Y2I5A8_9FUNG|nr:hypothetical protein BCR44DRAFT_1001359 [Catenaria anguillulae PL171]
MPVCIPLSPWPSPLVVARLFIVHFFMFLSDARPTAVTVCSYFLQLVCILGFVTLSAKCILGIMICSDLTIFTQKSRMRSCLRSPSVEHVL